MALPGLKEEHHWNYQENLSLKPARTISTDIPRNIPGDIPPLAGAFKDILEDQINFTWNRFHAHPLAKGEKKRRIFSPFSRPIFNKQF